MPLTSLPSASDQPVSAADKTRSPRFSEIWLVPTIAVLLVAGGGVAWLLAAPAAQPNLVWSTSSLAVTLAPGDTATRTLTLTSDTTLKDAQLEAVTPIAPYLTIQPASFSTLQANKPQTVNVVFKIPAGARLGTYDGTIHVRTGTSTLPQTLKIVVNAWQSFSSVGLGITFALPPGYFVTQSPTSVELSSVDPISIDHSEDFSGICDITIDTTSKPDNESVTEWLAAVRAANGEPKPLSDIPVLVNGVASVYQVTAELSTVDSVYVPRSPTSVLSLNMVCGPSVVASGRTILKNIYETIKFSS